jgi:hypothetical protein
MGFGSMITTKTPKELEECKEPTDEEIRVEMKRIKENYYVSREALRQKAYGGKPPGGYSSWGDYWKSY